MLIVGNFSQSSVFALHVNISSTRLLLFLIIVLNDLFFFHMISFFSSPRNTES